MNLAAWIFRPAAWKSWAGVAVMAFVWIGWAPLNPGSALTWAGMTIGSLLTCAGYGRGFGRSLVSENKRIVFDAVFPLYFIIPLAFFVAFVRAL